MQALLPRTWVFSHVFGCAACWRPTRTLPRTSGSRPSSVARALGVHSRDSLLFFKGVHSALPSRAGPWKPTIRFVFALSSLRTNRMIRLLVYLYITPNSKLFALWQPPYNSSRDSTSSVCVCHGQCSCACMFCLVSMCIACCHVITITSSDVRNTGSFGRSQCPVQAGQLGSPLVTLLWMLCRMQCRMPGSNKNPWARLEIPKAAAQPPQ